MFDELPLFRNTDPATSRAAAADVRIRQGSQLTRLLAAYGHPAASEGITDDEAAAHANLSHTGYWKRCSDLRNLDLIRPTGQTRIGRAGNPQMVCAITYKGLGYWDQIRMENARAATN